MNYTFDNDSYSDLYKDAYGFRPRTQLQWWATASNDEKQIEWDRLLVVLDAAIAESKREQQESIERFETLVEETIASGAATREDAYRWIMEGSSCDGDWEHLCYQHGLPYSFFKKAA
jgi:hypothetical protein